MRRRVILSLLLVGLLLVHISTDAPQAQADAAAETPDGPPKVEEKAAGVPPGSTTDTQTQEREKDSMRKSGEKFQFQAEVSRLMDIIINSLYSNKDIFLRELISNASDALDKIRFLSLTDKSVLGEGDMSKLEIKIKLDKDNKILSIRDRGIGMTKEDLIKNLGTIAKSGTSAFVEKMQTSGDLSLIGQFGVGFYSVYLVADYVEVHSKNNDDKQWVWASAADGNFNIYEDTESEPLERGTEIRIHLKEDASEYLEEDKLKDLVKRYSQFINFPIYLWGTKQVEVEVPDESETETETETETEKEDEKTDGEKDKEGEEASEEEDGEEEEEDEPKTKTVLETRTEWNLLNDVKAIWLRNPKDISDTEYIEFYKSVGKDYSGEAPLEWTHFVAEGDVEFKAILFVPPKAPHDMYENYYSAKAGLKLYVRRVFISDDFEDLLPKYLNFLKGLVDSDSLPLNVSREMLQQHGALKTIKKKLVRKALDMIRKMADEDEKASKDGDKKEDTKYLKFWKEFGKALKLGVIEDANNRMRLAKLLRIKTSKFKDSYTTLDEYIGRMKEGQKQIYYLTGSSIEQLERSPFLEKLLKKGYEVIYFTDPVDEYLMQNLTEYEEKKFQNASKEDLKIGTKKEREKAKELKDSFKDLTAWWKKQLGPDVEAVKVSDRLAQTPCIVVTSKYGWSANMERIMTSQALGDASKQSYMKGRKTLEVNPRHPIVKELKDIIAKDTEDESTKEMARILYDTALLESGFSLGDPTKYAERIYDTVRTNLGIDPNAEVEEEEETPEPEGGAKEEEEDDDPGPQMEGFEEFAAGQEEEESKPGINIEEVPADEAEALTKAAGGKDEL